MENLTPELNFALTFLILVTGIAIIFFIPLLVKVTELIFTFTRLSMLIEQDYKPLEDEIYKILKNARSISDKADKHATQISEGIDTAAVKTSSALQKFSVLLASWLHGVSEGLKNLQK